MGPARKLCHLTKYFIIIIIAMTHKFFVKNRSSASSQSAAVSTEAVAVQRVWPQIHVAACVDLEVFVIFIVRTE